MSRSYSFDYFTTVQPDNTRHARPVADLLLSHEGHELRIGPRVRPLA